MQTLKGAPIEDLGDGLIVRHVTAADEDELSDFNARMHADPGQETDESIRIWTRDLFRTPPPAFRIDDFTVVENTRGGRIVSSLCLISQTWSYAGVPFGVGQVEAVATDPAFRRKGLVRKQFEIVHRWSAARGELVQVVSGIPWYYRQFGYEQCVAHGQGRAGIVAHVPALSAGEREPFRVRPATAADVPFIERVAATAAERYLLTCARTAAQWRYEIEGHTPGSLSGFVVRLIETAAGMPLGFLAHRAALHGGGLSVTAYELVPGASWLTVTPSVLRYLVETGRAYAARDGGAMATFAFGLETEHPVYDAIPTRLPLRGGNTAWFIRVADLPRFLRRIAPVLARRLAGSVAAGYTGELRLNLYRSGLRLRFEAGRLVAAEPWPEHDFRPAHASFPDLTFLQLLFGHRSLEELVSSFADCSAPSEQGRVLLGILFPRQASLVWQIS